MSALGKFKKGPVVKLKLPRPKKQDKADDKVKEEGPAAAAVAGTEKQERKKPVYSFSDSDDDDFKDPIAFKRDMKIKELLEQDSTLSRRRNKKEAGAVLTNSKALPPPPASSSTTSTTTKRGRKKAADTAQLPLFKATESEKGAAIEDRLGMVLDANSDKAKADEALNQFYVRDPMEGSCLEVSERLEKYRSKNKAMWNLSNGEVNSKDEAYVTESVSEVKHVYDDRIPPKTVKQVGKELTSTTEKFVSKKDKSPLPLPVDIKKSDRTPNAKARTTPSHVDNVKPSTTSSSNHQLSLTSYNPDAQNALLCQLSLDFLRVFANKEDADLTVYGREEKRIRCHKLIIKARCPGLLKEITQETTPKGNIRDIISLTCFSHLAVKAFIKFLYSCKMNCLTGQDFNDFMDLASRYNIKVFQSMDIPPAELNSEKRQTAQLTDNVKTTNNNSAISSTIFSSVKDASVPEAVAEPENPVVSPMKSQLSKNNNTCCEAKEDEENDSGANVSVDLFEMSGENSIEKIVIEEDGHNGSLMDIFASTPEKDTDTATDWFEREFCSNYGGSGENKALVESGVVAQDSPDSFDKDYFDREDDPAASEGLFENSAVIVSESKTVIDNNIMDVVWEEDPFAEGDSCFLNVPSVILPPSQLQSHTWCSTPVPSSSQRKRSVKSVAERENFSPSPVTTQKTQKPKKNKPTKPKTRLSRARAQSQDPSPASNAGTSKSKYSLDYSTIDTPILKKELKRYGLKPLPRSKAKLILRHIEDETKPT